MKLKAIKLFGFKSFSRKTELILPSGITAIVGPNGAGKSNLVDALLWVLGEHRPRLLRSPSASELLYSGNGRTKPASLAEVSLSLELDGAHLSPDSPLKDLSELLIARRLHRSGESHYFVNQIPFRHRDVRDLLLELGLSSDSYALVSQYEVDRLVRTDPLERRAILEQAAGIARFRLRRQEILDKMEKTERNLVRLRDLLRELETQWLSLSEEMERAKKYQELYERLRWLQIALLGWEHSVRLKRLHRLQDEWEELQHHIAADQQKLNELSSQSQTLDHFLEELEERRVSLQKDLTAVRDQQKELESLQARLEDRLAYLEQWTKQTRQQLTAYQEKKEVLEGEKVQTDQALDDLVQRCQVLKADTDALIRQVEEATRTLHELDESEKRATERHFEAERALSEALSQLRSCQPLKKALTDRQTELEKEEQEVTRRLQEIKEAYDRLLHDRQQTLDTIASLSQQRSERDRQIREVSREHDTLEQELLSLEREILTLKGRYEALAQDGTKEAEEKGLESSHPMEFLASVRQVLGDQPVRLVRDFLSVDPQWEKALESFLGDCLGYLVVETWDQGLAAAQFLSQQRTGPVGIIVLQASQDISLDEPMIPDQPDSLWAQIIISDPRLERILKKWFGPAIITDLPVSLPPFASRQTLVTPAGQTIVPWGLIRVPGQRATSFLEKARIQEELSKRREELERRQADLLARREQVAADHQHLSLLLNQLDEELRLENQKLLTIAQKMEALTEQERSLKEQWQRIKGEQVRLEADLSQLDQWIAQEEATIREREQVARQQSEEAARLRAIQEETQKKIHSLTSQIEALQQQTNLAEAEKVRLTEQSRFLAQSLSEIDAQIRQLTQAKEDRQKETLQVRQSLAELRERLTAQRREREKQERQLSELIAERDQTVQRMRQLTEERERLRTTLEEKKEEAHRLELKLSQTQSEMAEIERRLTEGYQTTVAHAHAAADQLDQKQTALSELESVKAQMEQMGPVSLSVLEEGRRLQERIEFLRSQVDDLEKTIALLQENLQKVEEGFAEEFRQTLNAVSEEFNQILTRFWSDGSGGLRLTEGPSLAESGVEVYLRIPGKPERELMALSGGEKAIVGICLLFALMSVCPVPFAVLDEVDAPLDDQNTDHFCSLLNDFAETTQFLVVTHNAITVQAADHLYGVTLREDGSSQVLSLSLKEALQWAREP
ncbi:MAG: chromosome segregation protein SMC [Armatimonadetes bacterium]|nr:chromosome segregation protein SMC [Armatimonadota bacterium]MDW8122184.1 chromosome segregation protein SMC [Armatimonadota bacterium]